LKARRKLAFAAALNLALFLGVEVAAHLVLGPPAPPRMEVPGMAGMHALHVADGVLQVPFQGNNPLPPVAVQAAQTRVVFLGGSSVHAVPPPIGLEEWPHLTADRLGVEAVNLGAPAMDSGDVAALAGQLDLIEHDVVVVYTGHNDLGNAWFLQRYGGQRSHRLLERSWIYSAARQATLPSLPMRRPNDPLPVLLSERERQAAMDHFERNLERTVWLCARNDVTVVLSTVASNLLIEPTDTCTGPTCPRTLWAQGLQAPSPERERLLRQARDADPMSIRAPSAVNERIRAVAQSTDAQLMDLEALLPREPGMDVPAQDVFRDTLHFSDAGMHVVADTVAAWLADELESPDVALQAP
jgi:lysophospholipase L1-like esterase